MTFEIKKVFVTIISAAGLSPHGIVSQVGNSPMPSRGDGSNDSRGQAFATRAAWMRKMGFADDEIKSACTDDGSPIDLNEEQEHLYYADKLKEITPSRSVLEAWAIKS